MQKNHFLIAMALCAGALATSAMGCELIASVDRSLLQQGEGGGGGAGGAGGAGGTGGDAPSCTDEKKNGNETDVDCGGGDCPKCEQGKACSEADDCDSGFCADGVCCDTACDEACDSCTAALKGEGEDGTCGPSKAGAPCSEASCTDGQQQDAATCDEDGQCVESEPTECGAYACDEEGTACRSECEADEHCAVCHVCGEDKTCEPVAAGEQGSGCSEATQACNADNVCAAANGETCDDAADCGSGFCVDGVCCDAACDGECQACNVEGKVGTCSTVAAGTEEPTCTAPENICDSAGACKKAAQAECTTNEECASNECLTLPGGTKVCTAVEPTEEEPTE